MQKYMVISALMLFILALFILIMYPYKIATILPYIIVIIAMSISSIALLISNYYSKLKGIVILCSVLTIVISALPLLNITSLMNTIDIYTICVILLLGIGLSIIIDQNTIKLLNYTGKIAIFSYALLYLSISLFKLSIDTTVIALVLLTVISLTSITPFFIKNYK